MTFLLDYLLNNVFTKQYATYVAGVNLQTIKFSALVRP